MALSCDVLSYNICQESIALIVGYGTSVCFHTLPELAHTNICKQFVDWQTTSVCRFRAQHDLEIVQELLLITVTPGCLDDPLCEGSFKVSFMTYNQGGPVFTTI